MAFKRGKSGNPHGRPLGARNRVPVKVEEMVLAALEDGKGGVAHLVKLKTSKVASDRAAFISLVARLIPRQIEGDLTLTTTGEPTVKVILPWNGRADVSLMGASLVRETEAEYKARTKAEECRKAKTDDKT